MKKLLLTAAVLMLPTMYVQAADEAATLFNQLDSDQSGLLSQEEAKAHPELASLFSDLDIDKDNQLNLSEFDALTKK
jgi:hypothetical protein